jgi:hypothetical protein
LSDFDVIKMAIFWVVAPCSLLEVCQRFRGPCCLHHQGPGDGGATTQKTASHIHTRRRENLKSCLTSLLGHLQRGVCSESYFLIVVSLLSPAFPVCVVFQLMILAILDPQHGSSVHRPELIHTFCYHGNDHGFCNRECPNQRYMTVFKGSFENVSD